MITNIRRMKDSDIDEVYNIERGAHVAPWTKEILRDCVIIGYDCRVIEICDGESTEIVGYMIVRHGIDTSHILNFCIAKPRQSHGYGRRFIESFLSSLAIFPKIQVIMLEVRPSNIAALNLYHSLGFIQSEIKQGYYVDDNSQEDAIVLKKSLYV